MTEQLLCCYAAYLAEEGLAPSSIKSYLAVVRDRQLSLGLPEPREQSSLPLLKRVQAGIGRVRLSRGRPCKQRLPITTHMLRQMKVAVEVMAHEGKLVLWAICCVAFFGLFRLGELLLDAKTSFNTQIHLAWGDVAVDDRQNPTMVRLHSKTDQAEEPMWYWGGRTRISAQ